MKELVVAGYKVAHVALLARAVLSRQQAEWAVSDEDVAMLSREVGDFVSIREPLVATLLTMKPLSRTTSWDECPNRLKSDFLLIGDWGK